MRPRRSASAPMRFVELSGNDCKRLHIGIVLATGPKWAEVSVPRSLALEPTVLVRLHPHREFHLGNLVSRSTDRVRVEFSSLPREFTMSAS